MKGTIAATVFLLAIPCAAQDPTVATSEGAYLESALKWPTYFGVTAGEFDQVWQRARIWAENYGGGALTVLSESEITTIRPPTDTEGARTLRITNTETFGGFRISVEVVPHRSAEAEEAQKVAHLLAYHLATGTTVPETLYVSR